MITNRREYVAALAETKALSEIDKRDLTSEQINRRKQLYEAIAEFEKRK